MTGADGRRRSSLIAIPLVAVLWSVISRGVARRVRGLPGLLHRRDPARSRGSAGPGMGPAIVGTLLVTGGATLIAVPLGILGAIYLHEYGGTGRSSRGSCGSWRP